MAATFFSGFKDKQSALNFLLEKIYAGFQMQSSICVVLKDEEHCADFKKSQQRKYFENAKIDDAYSIDDHEALPILYDLIQNEGLSLGTSCGINIAGAIRLGKELGPGKTIVTILCDKSDKYNSKMFNKSFLREKNLPIPSWL